MTSERMIELLVDAQLGRESKLADASEKAFRKKMDAEVASAKKNGTQVAIPTEWVGAAG